MLFRSNGTNDIVFIVDDVLLLFVADVFSLFAGGGLIVNDAMLLLICCIIYIYIYIIFYYFYLLYSLVLHIQYI